MKKKLGLGKGFSGQGVAALINTDKNSKNGSTVSKDYEVVEIDIDKLTTNPYQPRKEFDEEKLEELKTSIIKYGLLQPIIVRETNDGFEIVAGERRTKACKLAGLKKIPARIISIKADADKLELALIENIHRDDLNPIEVALSYQMLIKEFRYTQETLAIKIGKERSTVSNILRLLKLPDNIQNLLLENKISMGHAKALLSLDNHIQMIAVANDIIDKDLSVRATESLVRNIQNKNKKSTIILSSTPIVKQNVINSDIHIMVQECQNKLREKFVTNVKIALKNDKSGNINIEFYSIEDLERLIDIIN